MGRAILPAAAFPAAPKRRLKADGSQNWLPHNDSLAVRDEDGLKVPTDRNGLDGGQACIFLGVAAVPEYNGVVEKVVRKFESFADADEADARFYATLTPEERLQILIELRDRTHPDAAEQGLARVSRVVELERS